ncbi:MAG: VanZ family protein [Planctomycetes bacterium]|nr:VanZ family protein [Planctomycetota bacterium]
MRAALRPGPTILAVIATAVVVAMLLTPATYVPQPHFPHEDKLEHAGVFCVLALLWRWARLGPLPMLIGACVLASTTEILQAVLPIGRDGEVLDAVADLAGACIGALIARLVSRPSA